MTADLPAPSVDTSPGLKLLPTLLSVIAGSADVISFLGLGGLFVAHITGNLVILAAHVVTGTRVGIAPIVSVPVFILVLGLMRLLAAGLEAVGIASLRPLLVLQFVLLAGFLAVSVSTGPRIDPDAASGVIAGMLGVSAMAVQNALVQISVRGAPATAVMTTNITRFTMDVGGVLLGRDRAEVAAARRRAAHTWPAIVGFAAGAALGAALFMAAGPSSVALPTGLALLALASVHRRKAASTGSCPEPPVSSRGRRPGEGCRRQAARRRQDAGPATFPASRKAHRRLPGDAGDMTLRCLIVDDSRRFLDAARGLLERQGITVVGEASTSAEALRLAVELQPDVTLLDIDLGGESGFELARRLSREADTALPRMILISTHAEQDYADLIAASPAVGFLSKSALSAGAIRDLLGSQGDRDPGD